MQKHINFSKENIFLTREDGVRLEALLVGQNEDVHIIVSEPFARKCAPIIKSLGFNIVSLFDLSNVVIGTCVNFFVFVLSKSQHTKIHIGEFFEKELYDRCNRSYANIAHLRFRESGAVVLEGAFTDDYKEYLSVIENAIEDINYEIENDKFTISLIGAEDFDEKCPIVKRYGKKMQKLKSELSRILQSEEIVSLKDVADVIPGKYGRVKGNIISPANCSHPFDYSKLKASEHCEVKIDKNDILYSRGTIGFISEELKQDVYISQTTVLIRPKNISPEYLFVYLSSDTVKDILSLMGNGFLEIIDKKDVENIPVPLPQKSKEVYERFFKQYFLKDTNEEFYYDLFKNNPEEQSSFILENNLIEEMLQKTTICHNDSVSEMIRKDLEELRGCFSVKAYKAAIILAGSILEAFLIDWLSVKHGKDYFKEDFFVDKNGRPQRADLIDYIDAIKQINRPKWMEEAKMSHTIRKQRNLVHAKLCIDKDNINERTCLMVIEYLENIIKTRFDNNL